MEAGKTEDTILAAQAKDDGGLEQGGSNGEEEKRNWVTHILLTELIERLGEGDSMKESKMILRGLALLSIWMRAPLNKR